MTHTGETGTGIETETWETETEGTDQGHLEDSQEDLIVMKRRTTETGGREVQVCQMRCHDFVKLVID